MKELDELLALVSDEDPTGPDMDESVEFDRLRIAFEANFPFDAKVKKPDKDVPPPTSVDWSEVVGEIEGLSEQTKDLYLAASYARCGIVLGDLEVVERGLMYVAGLLEVFWNEVHPRIDGDLGYRGRAGICEGIAQRGSFILPFLEMPIVQEGRISLTASQIRDAHENGAASQDYPVVKRLLTELEEGKKEELSSRLASVLATFDRIEQVMKGKAEEGDPPDFAVVRDTVEKVRNAYLELAELTVSGTVTESDDDEVSAGSAVVGASSGYTGTVRSRDDVLRALTEIEQYYTQAEPGHPVKVALARMRGWVTKDFMQILEDIVPNSIDDAKNVLLERDNVE